MSWHAGARRRGLLLPTPVDDDRRCRDCDGGCCRSFPTVALSWGEYCRLEALGARRLVFAIRGPHHLVIENGCEFLVEGRCSIYADRPEICRHFICER